MENIFRQISDLLEEGRSVALARIIRQAGSSPRAAGAVLLVLEDGAIRGTIGGGRLEYEVTAKAKDNFAAGRAFSLHFELTGTEVGSSDKMICGGVVDVYTEYLSPRNVETRSLFKGVADSVCEGRGGLLITILDEGRSAEDLGGRIFLARDGSFYGALEGFSLNEEEQRKLLDAASASPGMLERGGKALFVEPVEPDDVLYLFGAGHISTCLAPLAKMIGFRLVVVDDREEFCNSGRFPRADELLVTPFALAFDRIAVSPSSYLVIVTRGHLHDLTVIRSALRQSPAYIGMIGSSRKVRMIRQSLLEEGFPEERLARVHAPIGLDIGAETPEEIAVCIAAELIQVRAGLKKSS